MASGHSGPLQLQAVAAAWIVWWRLTGITQEQSKRASRRNVVQLLIANRQTAISTPHLGDSSGWLVLRYLEVTSDIWSMALRRRNLATRQS